MAVEFSDDGSKVVSVSRDSTIKIWSTHSGDEMKTLSLSGKSKSNDITCVHVYPPQMISTFC